MPVIKVNIDGKECESEKGEYILTVARRNNIYIPTLCHNEALPDRGCCRLCIVEVSENDHLKVVASCIYPLHNNCEVFTSSEKVLRLRRTLLELYRDEAPESEVIADLCKQYNVTDNDRFSKIEGNKCILCGHCASTCKLIGSGSISTVGRGIGKKVSTPYEEPSVSCIGCGSCAEVCPTKAITKEENNGIRTIWGKSFQLVTCKYCGEPFATNEEIQFVSSRAKHEMEEICPACRRFRLSSTIGNLK